ncbi:MAG: tRNA (adenosine(37)-N6)-dimethylallyltransferase MiaA [Planctomycetota bacterium]
MGQFPVICGPTASGKTNLAVAVALAFGERGMSAEIISADAFQVYRELDIASAKPTAEERKGVPHHLIDVVDVEERFTVAQWLGLAEAAIDDIRGRGSVPIVVGGTHLYIKALQDGLFEGPGADESIRADLAAMDAAARRAELERVDPEAALRIHANDDRRTIRALEVYRITGTPISAMQKQWDREPGRHGADRSDRRLVILDWDVPELNSRINARVKRMVQDGLVAETRALADRLGPTAREALGTKQVLRHLNSSGAGACTLDEAIEQTKIETRRFAKNQRTWMRRLAATPGARVVRPADRPLADIAQGISVSVLAD